MVDRSVNVFGVVALLGLLVGGCASEGTMGSSASGSAPASTKGITRIAAGAVEDSLAGCMGRIPGDASAGQKMVAEQSCRRDQGDRR